MKNLYIKKIGKVAVQMVGDVVVAGILALTTQKLREISNETYKGTKDTMRQGVNLTKNKIMGEDPEDWDL